MTQGKRPGLRSPRIQRAPQTEQHAASGPDKAEPQAEAAPRDLAALQRSLGNAGFARMMRGQDGAPLQAPNGGVIQRWTMPFVTLKSDEELAKDGLAGDRTAICEIRDFSDSSPLLQRRFELINVLLSAKDLGFREKSALVRIWDGFGDLQNAIEFKPDYWAASQAKGADLSSLKQVKDLKTKFTEVIRETALSYLTDNRTLVYNQMAEYGLSTVGDKAEPLTADQSNKMLQMQAAAEKVAINQKAQEAARETTVGYRKTREPVHYGPVERATSFLDIVKFDPNRPPERETDEAGHQANPKATYAQMRDAYEASTKSTRNFLKQFPALYGVSREGSSELTQKFAGQESPEKARAFMGKGLEGIRVDINKAMGFLDAKDGTLNPLDLGPIAEGLRSGTRKPAGKAEATVDWSGPLGSMVAKDALRDHDLSKALKTMGYNLATEALFMLAPFSGGASLFVALAGVGIQGAKANASAEEFEAMSAAAKTAIDPDKDIASEKEVSQAQMEMQADQTALALAALTAVGVAATGLIKHVTTSLRNSRMEQAVKDPATLQRLRTLAKDDAALDRLLRKTDDHAALEKFLIQAGGAVNAEALLETNSINFSQHLSSGGDKGSLAGGQNGPLAGVFEGRVKDVFEPVAVKVFPAGVQVNGELRDQTPKALDEMRSAEAVARAGGPRYYGRVPAPPNHIAYAMERVSGDFADPLEDHTDETRAAKARVTRQTAQDARDFGQRVFAEGRYAKGDYQGLVTPEGRWRVIDAGSFHEVPTDTAGHIEAQRQHHNAVEDHARLLDAAAQENEAKGRSRN